MSRLGRQVCQLSRKVVPKAHHRSRPRRSVQPTILLPTCGPFNDLRADQRLPADRTTARSDAIPQVWLPASGRCRPAKARLLLRRPLLFWTSVTPRLVHDTAWQAVPVRWIFLKEVSGAAESRERGRSRIGLAFFEVPVACDRGKAGFGGAPCYRRTGLEKPEPVAQLSNGFPVPPADRSSNAGGSNPVRNSQSDALANSHSSPADSHHVPQAVAEHFVPQTSTDCSSPLSKSADAV